MQKIIFFVLLFTLLFPHTTHAQEKLAGDSASLGSLSVERVENPALKKDYRAKKLEHYLEKYHSPLATEAQTFVEQADLYNIDWKILPAIAGVESTFGQNEPSNCNNGWGYGIYGDHMICFVSYEEAIKTISKAMRETYINTFGDTNIYAIGRHYAASPTWAGKVEYFMEQITEFQWNQETTPITLPISL